jgi:hypothetical protein
VTSCSLYAISAFSRKEKAFRRSCFNTWQESLAGSDPVIEFVLTSDGHLDLVKESGLTLVNRPEICPNARFKHCIDLQRTEIVKEEKGLVLVPVLVFGLASVC